MEPVQPPSQEPTNFSQTPPFVKSTPKTSAIQMLERIIFVVLLVAMGYLYYQNNQLKMELAKTTTQKTSEETAQPKSEVSTVWSEDQIPFEDITERGGGGKYAVSYEKPTDWIVTKGNTTTSNDHLIKPCTSYTIADPTKTVVLTYAPICGAWNSSQHVIQLSNDAVEILRQVRGGNAGTYTLVRSRDTVRENFYRYADSHIPNDTKLKKTTETLTIGFAPPVENTGDFYYTTATVTLEVSRPDDSALLVQMADRIVGSLKLREMSTSAETSSPTQKITQPVANSFVAPATWKKASLMNNALTLCLAPQWEVHTPNEIIFNRDASYQPRVANIQSIPYTSGSRRDAYFTYWEKEYPNVRELVSITEIPVGKSSVLLVKSAKPDDPKLSPDGRLAFVWFSNNTLWKAEASGWDMVQNSESVFIENFYKAVSCSF